jgi:hypothetical protein
VGAFEVSSKSACIQFKKKTYKEFILLKVQFVLGVILASDESFDNIELITVILWNFSIAVETSTRIFLFLYHALSNMYKLTNKYTELYTSLFTRWLLHVSARHCHHQGTTRFLLSYFNVSMVGGKSSYNRIMQ